jgi:hypothetical protein
MMVLSLMKVVGKVVEDQKTARAGEYVNALPALRGV